MNALKTNKLLRLILAGLIAFQANGASFVFAGFDDLNRGARAPGFANSFVAIADDANALYYNPAGLAQIGLSHFSSEFSQLSSDVNDDSLIGTTYLAYAHPLRRGNWGTLGISYHNFDAANLFDEQTLSLGYGWKLRKNPFGLPGAWAAGLALKQLRREFNPDRFFDNALNDVGSASGQGDPLFSSSGNSKTAYAVDLGGLVRFGKQYRYSFGTSLTNINQPDMSLNGSDDPVPFVARAGLGYRRNWGLLSVQVRRIKQLATQSDTDVALGAERVWRLKNQSAVMLRGGYAEGSRDFKSVTTGAGFQFGVADFDYAFRFPVGNLSDIGGQHHLGLSLRFGRHALNQVDPANAADEDLIRAFSHNAKAAHALASRMSKAGRLDEYDRMLMLQALVRKYRLDDPNLNRIRDELSRLQKDYKSDLTSWPRTKMLLIRSLRAEDHDAVAHLFDLMAGGKTSEVLARSALLEPGTRNNNIVASLESMVLAEKAAESYRAKNYTAAINHVRQILGILPKDEAVLAAYRELVRLQLLQKKDRRIQKITPPVPSVEVEAPIELRAPIQTTVEQPVQRVPVIESYARSFAESLGYYFTRKGDGAPLQERKALLQQMMTVYGATDLNLSVVEDELRQVMDLINNGGAAPETRPKPKPRREPVKKPVAPVAPEKVTTPAPEPEPAKAEQPKETKPAPKKKAKPKKTLPIRSKSRVQIPAHILKDAKKSWRYYQKAIQLGAKREERIQILNTILMKFGEKGAPQVIKELNRIRKQD